MWLWDSAFHSLGANQVLGVDVGFDYVAAVLDEQRSDGYVAIRRDPNRDARSSKADQTQPPLLAWATWQNYAAAAEGGEAARRARERLRWALPRLEKYLQWDARERGDAEGATQLLRWTKGTESGMDNSQRFDNSSTMLAVDFSVFASCEASYLSKMHDALGNESGARLWSERAQAISADVHGILWDASRGGYYDRASADGDYSDVAAVSGLLPLLLDDLPVSRAGALAEAIGTGPFSANVSLPSVALGTRDFSTDMWRGPMWVNYNYMVSLGLERHGYHELASSLKQRAVSEVGKWYEKHATVFEFYDSTGTEDPTALLRKGARSGGVRDYHWTAALVALMLAN